MGESVGRGVEVRAEHIRTRPVCGGRLDVDPLQYSFRGPCLPQDIKRGRLGDVAGVLVGGRGRQPPPPPQLGKRMGTGVRMINFVMMV